MKFLNPAGLWFLLGIPVLIIIYIIKSPHDDKQVSSTYIWKLSSRFMRKKLPLNKLRKILGFLFQLALITGAALLSARPVKVVGVRTNYILIFDASASMRTKNTAGESRFERAIPIAKEYAGETENNNEVTIITASDEASLILSSSSDPDEIKLVLDGISCGYGGCNLDSAYSLAKDIAARCANSEIVLFTDKDYNPGALSDIGEAIENGVDTETLKKKTELPENTVLYNMASAENEWNAYVKSFDYEISANSPENASMGGFGGASSGSEGDTGEAAPVKQTYVFTAEIACTGRDAEFSCAFMLDGKPRDAEVIKIADGETVTISFTEKLETFDTAEIIINPSDGLDTDNSYGVCRRDERILKILVCGPSPYYILNALRTLDNVEITERIPEEFDWQNDVYYDLYIFDCFTPRHYPEDGSLLLIGCDTLPTGISQGDPAELPTSLKQNPSYEGMYFKNLLLKGTMIDGYCPLSLTSEWEKLFQCNGKPVIASRKLTKGITETVISFDLHNSNLPMMTDFPLIIKDIVAMSTTDMIEAGSFTVGSPVKVNAKFNTTKLFVTDSDEQITNLNFEKGYGVFTPDKSGLYTVSRWGKYSFQKENLSFYAGIPKTEYSTDPITELPEIALQNEKIQTEYATGDLRTLIALILLALLLLEWGLYYYEQY